MAQRTNSVSFMVTRTRTMVFTCVSVVFTRSAQVRFTSRKRRLIRTKSRYRGILERGMERKEGEEGEGGRRRRRRRKRKGANFREFQPKGVLGFTLIKGFKSNKLNSS